MKELPSDYQKFIHTSRYARWLEKEKRRGDTLTFLKHILRKSTNIISHQNSVKNLRAQFLILKSCQA